MELIEDKKSTHKYVKVAVSEGNRHEKVSPKYNTYKEAEDHMVDSPHDYTTELVIKVMSDSIIEPISAIWYNISDNYIYHSLIGAIEHRTDGYNIIHSEGILCDPKDVTYDSYGLIRKNPEYIEDIYFIGETHGDIFKFTSTNDCIASEFVEEHGKKVIKQLLTANKWAHDYFDENFYK